MVYKLPEILSSTFQKKKKKKKSCYDMWKKYFWSAN